MKIAIIADDLTGANDTGVQFAKKGLMTSVLMKEEIKITSDLDVLIMDTDSRSQSANKAYELVSQAAKIIDPNRFDIVYKKVDSTMRGNIGTELDAVFDVIKPDLLVLAPGYPLNHRIVENGHLYLEGKALHKTDFSRDPKTPMTDSYIPNILRLGTERPIALITSKDLAKGSMYVQQKTLSLRDMNYSYILFDTYKDEELRLIVESVKKTNLNVVWAGSAGLAEHLIADTKIKSISYTPPTSKETVFMVIGSVNQNSRNQLNRLLTVSKIKGIEFSSQFAVKDKESLDSEIERVLGMIDEAIKDNLHIVLFSSGNPTDIILANKYGKKNNLSPQAVSDCIAEVLGKITSYAVLKHGIRRLFMTGGDTSKSVCKALNIAEFRLFDEIQTGVPIGMLVDENEILAITKAGGFGSLDVLLRSLEVLGGEKITCDQL